MADYTDFDIKIRKAWMQKAVSDEIYELCMKSSGGIKCREDWEKAQMILGFIDVLDKYDPDEDYNHVTEEEMENMVELFTHYYDIYFAPPGLTE